jgi:hypothetical protein
MSEQARVEEESAKQKPRPPGEYKMLALLFVICVGLFVDSLRSPGLAEGISNGPGSIPQLVAALLILMVAALAVQFYRSGYKEGSISQLLTYLFDKEVVILLITISIYGFILELLTFVPSTFLFLVSTMYLLERKQLKLKIAVSAGTVGALYFIFSTLFRVVLP